MIDRDLAALNALGKMEEHLHAMSELATRLNQVPMWLPSHALGKQATEAHRMMTQMQERMDRRLVVTLIGPSGSGKSTLLNALAKVDDLSPVGSQRPTTQSLVVLGNEPEAIHELLGPLDETQVQIRSSRDAELLSQVILIDTPDTDSTKNEQHWPLILHTVARSDVLICVFDAQNPKRRDHADFMAPLVRRFHGASLVAVVNQCDRLDAKELQEVIAPEFRAYLREAWDIQPEDLLLISARRHLQRPQWDPQAGPRHELDQFDQLRRLIFETFERPGFGQDRRLANARQINDYIQAQVHEAVEQDRTTLQLAAQLITAAEQQALRQAVESLRKDGRRMALGVNVRLYHALSQRWMGPVGWMVAIWSRLMVFGTGLSSLMRHPLHQLWGLISAWRENEGTGAAAEAPGVQSLVDSALQAFQRTWWTHWPEIGELLIQGRFDRKVRQMEIEDGQAVGRLARAIWVDSLDSEIESSARHLSHAMLQIIFNLPSLVLLGYMAWLTVARFVSGSYLAGGFFLNAFLAIILVLLLSFFIFQVFARLTVNRDRIQRRAFQAVERTISQHQLMAGRDVAEQVDRVMKL